MSSLYLRENLTFDQARVQILHEGKDGKDLYMKGICIQGGIKNANQRVYPVAEIAKATKTLTLCSLRMRGHGLLDKWMGKVAISS